LCFVVFFSFSSPPPQNRVAEVSSPPTLGDSWSVPCRNNGLLLFASAFTHSMFQSRLLGLRAEQVECGRVRLENHTELRFE
jgi:hypothetical protein